MSINTFFRRFKLFFTWRLALLALSLVAAAPAAHAQSSPPLTLAFAPLPDMVPGTTYELEVTVKPLNTTGANAYFQIDLALPLPIKSAGAITAPPVCGIISSAAYTDYDKVHVEGEFLNTETCTFKVPVVWPPYAAIMCGPDTRSDIAVQMGALFVQDPNDLSTPWTSTTVPVSCLQPPNLTGPQGEAGNAGIDGAAGKDGPMGLAGPAGPDATPDMCEAVTHSAVPVPATGTLALLGMGSLLAAAGARRLRRKRPAV